MNRGKLYSVQEWLPFEKILNNGVIKINSTSYIKILKIKPINYQLKSSLEKKAILHSYQIFLKTCKFDFQLIIQNTRQDIFQFISKIPSQEENPLILSYIQEYQNYIQKFYCEKNLCHKNFFLILKYSQKTNSISENKIMEELNENYYKVKETLSRCGNSIIPIEEKKEIITMLESFFHPITTSKEGDGNT